MKKVAVIYWSGSGNTETMAKSIVKGLNEINADYDIYFVSDFNAELTKDYDALILGCPAMGAEVLEECEFQPVYDEMKSFLTGKQVALFGSYGWGSGEWMQSWEADIKESGAILFEKGLIINELPQENDLKLCVDFAKRFVQNK